MSVMTSPYKALSRAAAMIVLMGCSATGMDAPASPSIYDGRYVGIGHVDQELFTSASGRGYCSARRNFPVTLVVDRGIAALPLRGGLLVGPVGRDGTLDHMRWRSDGTRLQAGSLVESASGRIEDERFTMRYTRNVAESFFCRYTYEGTRQH
jgi:hypothetical protein